jgi:CheY-like chemotaxis protein
LRQIPVIALSAYDPAQHRAVAIAAGCNDYVTKPIDYDRLEKLIENFLPAHGTANMPETTTPTEILSF